jgi:hypothetical protein
VVGDVEETSTIFRRLYRRTVVHGRSEVYFLLAFVVWIALIYYFSMDGRPKDTAPTARDERTESRELDSL